MNLSNALGDLGDPASQSDVLQRALRIGEGHYSDVHYEVAVTFTSRANAHADLGDPAVASACCSGR